MCGASSQQQQIEQEQQQYYSTLTQQAQQEFGLAMSNYNDLYSALSPIVAGGINQQGFNAAELTDLNNQALQGSSQAYTSAAQSAREHAAAGGGSNFVPSGATMQTNALIGASAAQQQSSELNQIQQANYATGRQNFLSAVGDLNAASGVLGAGTGAANAATAGGSAAANTANQIAQENNSWVQAVTGALGGVAGSIATGGMENLGAGVGFWGQNAAPPTAG